MKTREQILKDLDKIESEYIDCDEFYGWETVTNYILQSNKEAYDEGYDEAVHGCNEQEERSSL